MKLLTKAIEKKLPRLYSTDGNPDKVAIVKFFDPSSGWIWYGIEYNPEERLFFGYVVSGLGPDCNEYGYFSLGELENVRSRFGLGVERDMYFSPTPMESLIKKG